MSSSLAPTATFTTDATISAALITIATENLVSAYLGINPATPAYLPAFLSVEADLGVTPYVLNGGIDYTQPMSNWVSEFASDAGWLAAAPNGTLNIPDLSLPMVQQASGVNELAVLQSIAAGDDDAIWNGIIDDFKKEGFTTLYLRPGWEMSGNWYPWSVSTTQEAQAFIAAFDDIAQVAHSATGITVEMIWDPATVQDPAVPVQDMYPGNQYVDMIGVDEYDTLYPYSDGTSASGADLYYDWTTGQSEPIAQWWQNTFNLQQYWDYPSETQYAPQGAPSDFGLVAALSFAAANGKPFVLPETGDIGDGVATGPLNNPYFPAYLAQELLAPGAPTLGFISIWDKFGTSSQFSSGASPVMAAAWAQFVKEINQDDPGPAILQGGLTVAHNATIDLLPGLEPLIHPGRPGDTENISAPAVQAGAVALGDDAVWYTSGPGGTDVISFTVTDQLGDSLTTNINITIDPGPTLDSAPVKLLPDETISLAALGALLVTPGLRGDHETFSNVTAEFGTLTNGPNGLTYTAPASGLDVLGFTVNDQAGDSVSGFGTIEIDPGPTAAPGSTGVTSGQTANFAYAIGQLIHPGLSGDTSTIVAASDLTGTLTLGTNSLLYVAPESGTDTITYTVENQLGQTATGTFGVVVNPGNVQGTALQFGGANPAYGGGDAGITETLLTMTGTSIASITTGPGGYFHFVNVPAGTYQLEYGVPAGQEVISGTPTLSAAFTVAPGAQVDANGGSFVTTLPNPTPVLTGTQAGQATTDEAALAPFSGVMITDGETGALESVILTLLNSAGAATDANGSLSGAGLTKTGTGVYSLALASPASLSAELDALVFTPAAHEVTPGATAATVLELEITQNGATTTDKTTSIIATADNDPPTYTSVVLGQEISDEASLKPFSGVRLIEPDPGVADTLLLTLTGTAGLAAGAYGTLTGGGLSELAPGTYQLAGTTAALLSTELENLTFTPTPHQVTPGGTLLTDFLAGFTQDGLTTTSTLASVAEKAAEDAPVIQLGNPALATSDEAAISLFSGLTLHEPDFGASTSATIAVTGLSGIGTDADGTLAGARLSELAPGLYTLSATSPVSLAAELQALRFTPAAHITPPGTATSTYFGLTVTDQWGEPGIAIGTVSATAVNDAPALAGAAGAQTLSVLATALPFSGTSLFEPDPGITDDTATILLTGAAGTPASTLGVLVGPGLHTASAGDYFYYGVPPASLASLLQAITFVPNATLAAPGQTVAAYLSITLSQVAGGSTASSTSTLTSFDITGQPVIDIFTGGTDSNFANGANWLGGVAPGNTILAGDTVSIQSGTAAVTSAAITDNGLLAVAATFIDPHVLTGPGTLDVLAGGLAELPAGANFGGIADAGTLIAGGSIIGRLTLAGGTLAASGTASSVGTLGVSGAGSEITLAPGAGLTVSTPLSLAPGATLSIAGGTLVLDGGLSLTGAITESGTDLFDNGSLVNDGNISLDPSTLTIEGSLTGTGVTTLGADSTLDVTGNIAAGQTIVFAGTDAVLQITDTAAIAGTLSVASAAATIDITDLPFANFISASFNSISDLLGITYTGAASPLELHGDFAGYGLAPRRDGAGGTELAASLCYLRGTRILTPAGEVPVEHIAIGDVLVTRFGGLQKVKWIGRQTRAPRTPSEMREHAPVRIRAGALGEDRPARDLFVSPGHSMLVGETLLLAKLLVNGVTITQDLTWQTAIEYYQLEFETHDCIIAEGAWSESYADGPGLRARFDNAADYVARYPGAPPPEELALCAPRPERGARLDTALRPLVARAAAGLRPGPLRGWIDVIRPPRTVEGWACDEANPELPVLLEALLDGKVIGSALACAHRPDLAEAGFGAGNGAFYWTAPVRLPPDAAARLHFRRACDRAALPGSAKLPSEKISGPCRQLAR